MQEGERQQNINSSGLSYPPCRGDPNRTDDNGSTPLHVAATYGNLDSLELLITYCSNLFALDNKGRTAARVAAYYQKADCCRYLDTLAMRWQALNEDVVSKLQIKAVKELKKRSKKMAEEGISGKPKKISYDYSTAPVGGPPPLAYDDVRDRRASASDDTRRLSQSAALRQNFELRSGGSSSNSLEKDNSAGNTFTNLPRNRTGPLLNSLAQLPLRIEQPEDARHSMMDPFSESHSRLRKGKKSLPELELTHGHPTVTLNESALATFLNALDLTDCVNLLHREKLDLDALSMCSEEDLISIGLSLGPRKKILSAVARRKAILAGGGKLNDTEF